MKTTETAQTSVADDCDWQLRLDLADGRKWASCMLREGCWILGTRNAGIMYTSHESLDYASVCQLCTIRRAIPTTCIFIWPGRADEPSYEPHARMFHSRLVLDSKCSPIKVKLPPG